MGITPVANLTPLAPTEPRRAFQFVPVGRAENASSSGDQHTGDESASSQHERLHADAEDEFTPTPKEEDLEVIRETEAEPSSDEEGSSISLNIYV